MRILFISAFYPPHVIGGWEQLVDDLNVGLRSRGHQTCVLTSTHGLAAGPQALEREAGVERGLLLESDLQYYQPADFLAYGRRRQHNMQATQRVIEQFQPDVIFIHIMWNLSRSIPWLAEQLAPGRVVYYVADHWAYSPDTHELYWRDAANNPWRSLLKRLFAPLPLYVTGQDRKRFQLAFGRVLCVSDAIRQSMLANAPGLKPEQLQVVYNGIDLEAFPFRSRDLSERRDGLRLLYAGSLVPHKGVHTAIAAMGEIARRGELGGNRLTVVGSGRPDYEAKLRQAVAELHLEQHVHFAGRVDRSAMPACLADHDVLVFPSQWPEPLARMMQEAMACGLVVIGTTTGGSGEILLDGETGLVFAPGDATDLASRIVQLQANPALFTRLAANARLQVEYKFNFQRMLDQVECVLVQTAQESALKTVQAAKA
jgi:glycosyltransferase involved in cell wall biosynthesis